MRIGIDIGGVLVGKRQETNTLFDVPYSHEALEYLSQNNTLFIISYCKEIMAQHNFNTLVDTDLFWSQYYVSEKPYKSNIVQYLDCDVMIDDNENILNIVKKNNPQVITILFQRYNKQKKRKHRLHYLVDSWEQIVEIIDSSSIINKKSTDNPDPEGTGYFISP